VFLVGGPGVWRSVKRGGFDSGCSDRGRHETRLVKMGILKSDWGKCRGGGGVGVGEYERVDVGRLSAGESLKERANLSEKRVVTASLCPH